MKYFSYLFIISCSILFFLLNSCSILLNVAIALLYILVAIFVYKKLVKKKYIKNFFKKKLLSPRAINHCVVIICL